MKVAPVRATRHEKSVVTIGLIPLNSTTACERSAPLKLVQRKRAETKFAPVRIVPAPSRFAPSKLAPWRLVLARLAPVNVLP